jgi:hypothetical protein
LSGCDNGELVGVNNVLDEDRAGSGLSFACQPGFQWLPVCDYSSTLRDPICLDWIPGFRPGKILMMVPDTAFVPFDHAGWRKSTDKIVRRGLRSLYLNQWPLEGVLSFYYDCYSYDRVVHSLDFQDYIKLSPIRRTFTDW